MQVKEIMTKNPACCTPDSTLQEVAQMMVEHDCGCIPVVDSHLGMKPIGTITDRDITVRSFATGKNPLKLKASDIMTTDIVTIKPTASVQECSNVMKENDIRRVLVVDENGKCYGIVAQADVAQYGPNPNLISEVVHDISESAPSPNQQGTKEFRNKESFSVKKSFLNINSLLPLLAGLGAGAALKYYFYPEIELKGRVKVKRRIALPTDKAPEPIHTKPLKVSNSTVGQDTSKTASGITGEVTSSQHEETLSNKEIGRTATP